MNYIILFGVKIIDNIILTSKSICTYMDKRFLSSLLTFVSQILFYTVVKEVISDGSTMTIFVISLASFVGNYVAFPIVNKFKKDEVWRYEITSSSGDEMRVLCDHLVEHNIKFFANYGFGRHHQDTINVRIISKTKEQSRLIENYLKNMNNKYLKEIEK